MIKLATSHRRVLRNLSGFATVVSATMLVFAVSALLNGANPVAEAAPAGAAEVVGAVGTPSAGQPLASGGSSSAFTLRLPAEAACSGDSATGGYRVQSFMVPEAVDPATLKFNFLGPNPTGSGADYRQPLFNAVSGQRYVNITTGIGNGLIPTLPGFNFASATFTPGFVVAGTYNVGIACSKAAGAEFDKYWNVRMTFALDPNDAPSGLTWTVADPPEVTTTTTTTVEDTTTTSSTVVDTTTTTVAGATTTTVAGATSTTIPGGSTSATVTPSSPTPGGSYSVAFPNCQVGETITFSQSASTPASVTDVCEASSALTSGSVSGLRMPAQATTGTATGSFTAAPIAPGSYTVTMTGTASTQRTASFVIVGASTPITGGNTSANMGGSSTGSTTGTIPSTGSSTPSLIVWGVLLLVFGRMVILLGRKPKVLTGT